MEDRAVVASAAAEEPPSNVDTTPPPSSSSAPPDATPQPAPYDPLSKALQTLFLNVTTLVQGELRAANSEYELLERMNLRVASEHDNQADFAEGLRVFVERLKQKNDGFSEYCHQIDEIDHEVTELEAVVSTLDNYTINLESKIRVACAHPHARQFILDGLPIPLNLNFSATWIKFGTVLLVLCWTSSAEQREIKLRVQVCKRIDFRYDGAGVQETTSSVNVEADLDQILQGDPHVVAGLCPPNNVGFGWVSRSVVESAPEKLECWKLRGRSIPK